jgi:hypothetical protein
VLNVSVELVEASGRPGSLIIGELRYLSLDRRGAELFFEVLTEREQKASIAVASNEAFSMWSKTFTDPRLCGHRRPAHLQPPHHRDRRTLATASPMHEQARSRRSGLAEKQHVGQGGAIPPGPRWIRWRLDRLCFG